MTQVIFESPKWLLLLTIIPFLVGVIVAYLRWRNKSLSALGTGMHRLIPGFSKRKFWIKNTFLLSIIGLLSLALANPGWQGKSTPQKQTASDVIIAFDISKSMLANDLRPNRLVRARLFAQELLREIAGNRVGLLFFAGDAFLSMPLSTDYATINNFLAEADPESFSAQGTAIESVVNLARKSFDPEGGGRALVIITDGEDHEESPVDPLSDAFSEDGIVTYMVGAGTTQGGNISMGARGLLRDADNQPVLSKMDADMLNELAQAGKSGTGAYFIADTNSPAKRLAQEINLLKKKEIAVRSLASRESAYQWVVFPAVLLLIAYLWMEWRRSVQYPFNF